MNNIQLVILMAGKATRLYPLTLGFPKCLLSVRQKPSLYNMIVPLINKGLKDITLVVSNENKDVIEMFMNNSFKHKDVTFHYIVQDIPDGPGGALKLVAPKIHKPTLLLLGDTLCEVPNDFSNSWIGTCKVNPKTVSSWCMIEHDENNKIIDCIDKPEHKVNTIEAAIGIYFFKDAKLLKKVLTKKIKKIKNEYQLSSIFDNYRQKEDMYIHNFEHWEDIGTLENYRQTNSQNFNCRYFNKLKINRLGTINKKSSFEKISSEINWFEKVKNTPFECLAPRVFKTNKVSSYEMEYYDYLTLSEYNTFYPINDDNKQYIFSELIKMLYPIYEKNKQDINIYNLARSIYYDKTIYRINKWTRKDLIDKDYIKVNNVELVGLKKCLQLLTPSIEKICETSVNYNSIIHGDLSFANILYSPRNSIFRLLDPRGNFGEDSIYGDYRYDLAKLRHCYHGRYDEITNDLFEIIESDEISLTFYKDNNYELFDEILKIYKVDINDIELIEGLLFISMIPLHIDYPSRQLAFFIRGLTCLNSQINRRNLNENN